MKKILVVIPNDPLYKYYEKGEIKERYWNPLDYFDEIHVISLSKTEIEVDKVQDFFGKAKVFIYPIGKPKIYNYFFYKNKVKKLIEKISPNVIRANNPQIGGYLATFSGNKLNIPVIISLHTNYDKDAREFFLDNKKYPSYLKNLFLEIFAERYVLSRANLIIAAYRFPSEYAKNHGAKNIDIVYNRVYSEKFNPKLDYSISDSLKIICVGNLIKGKGQDVLIKAIKGINANLVLIGNGYLYDELVSLTERIGVQKKVSFVKSVANKDIPHYYKDADAFAIAIDYGGIAIPVIEAMATGLPIVVPKPKWEDSPELVGDFALVVDNDEKAFRDAFKRLIESEELRKQIGMKGRKRFLEINGEKMEQKEFLVYKKLVEREI